MNDKQPRKPSRVIIYVKDIQKITGKTRSSACRLYKTIRAAFDKKPHQFISFHEFSIYMGLDEEVIQENLRN